MTAAASPQSRPISSITRTYPKNQKGSRESCLLFLRTSPFFSQLEKGQERGIQNGARIFPLPGLVEQLDYVHLFYSIKYTLHHPLFGQSHHLRQEYTRNNNPITMTGQLTWLVTGCSSGMGESLAKAILASVNLLTAVHYVARFRLLTTAHFRATR